MKNSRKKLQTNKTNKKKHGQISNVMVILSQNNRQKYDVADGGGAFCTVKRGEKWGHPSDPGLKNIGKNCYIKKHVQKSQYL